MVNIDVFFKSVEILHQINNIRKIMKGLIEILLELFLIKFQVDSPVFFIQFFNYLIPVIPDAIAPSQLLFWSQV